MEPDGHVQQAQANHGEAHDGAGGEGHVQAPVQTLMGGVGGTGVGGGSDLHAHKTGQTGIDTAGEEGEGDKPIIQHTQPGQNQQNHEDYDKDLRDGGILTLKVSVSAFTNRSSQLLHQFGALGEP